MENLKIATAQFENRSGDKNYNLKKARRPELYRDIIGKDHVPEQKVAWLEQNEKFE